MSDAQRPDDDSTPVRFTLPMKPSFREKANREQAVGTPIRWSLGEDVMMQGIVVDWTDEPDGGVTLTVEATSSQ
ncbi:hypothetical protein [Streptomyces hygroscopicus]|uniref:hypothetical protein n=1 Tax=Streptomyces hygroscopicus TaxID=1912 RepID=UPI0033CA8622